ncbi:DnaJ domain-containing protein [Tribonema minus]|uniref:DnaJ domain-containing protein n=1 Tax=Tribonema minus TaxID=303371 RepID=A0A836C9Z0_9STRA|nr:DnaJ domain-containing protein [Tribonema minus]
MDNPEYYSVLGLQRGATDADIKQAFRKLAMRWHPDKNRDNAEEASRTFQEIGEAYDVLSDKAKRAVYDRYGYEGLRDGVPGPDGAPGTGYNYKQNAAEIFESFFGTRNPFADFGFGDSTPFAARLRKPGPRKAEPVVRDLVCTLEELFNGCTKRLKITRKRFAPDGELRDESKEVTVDVRPGWKRGTRVTFPSEGDEAPGIVPADVVFVVQEAPHARFSRGDGAQLVYCAPLSLADALTDCVLEVPTLDGRVLSLPCPEVVSPGYEKRVPKEGMPISKKPGQRGDLILRFKIVFPKYLPDDKKLKIRHILAGEIDMGEGHTGGIEAAAPKRSATAPRVSPGAA